MSNREQGADRAATSRRKRRLAASLGTAAVLAVQGIPSAQAQSFIDCLGWLVFDPDTHALNCLPSRVAVLNSSLSGRVTDTVFGPATSTGPTEPIDEGGGETVGPS
jgi:hypothetical protein